MTITEPELTAAEYDTPLTDSARAAIWGSWGTMARNRARLEMCRDYANGRGGIVDLDDGASEELRDLAITSRLNMGGVAVKTFRRGLSVVGFRSPDADEDDPAWAWWQAHRMDARQTQAHKHALTYGEGFVSVLPDDKASDPARPAFWSPLSATVEYANTDDLFPTSALLVRRTNEGYSVLMVDETTVTRGILRKSSAEKIGTKVQGVHRSDVEVIGEPWEHGGTYDGQAVCPVVRFTDETSDEDAAPGVGVVEPLIDLCRAMNSVNFDRLVVSRFGAFDQKLIIGWTTTKDRLIKLGSSKIGAIDEHPEDVRVDSWRASPLAPYNELIRELREQFALEAAIPLWAAGSISNVSTDTVAMIEAAHQRELQAKRDAYGESHEQLLRLAVAMSGGTQPRDDAEVIWRETQARTFGAVVDGIQKLTDAGVPVEELLDLIPGMTQQRIRAIKDGLRRNRSQAMLAALAAGRGQNGPGRGQNEPDGLGG